MGAAGSRGMAALGVQPPGHREEPTAAPSVGHQRTEQVLMRVVGSESCVCPQTSCSENADTRVTC